MWLSAGTLVALYGNMLLPRAESPVAIILLMLPSAGFYGLLSVAEIGPASANKLHGRQKIFFGRLAH